MGTPLAIAVQMWPTATEGDASSSGSRNLPGSGAHTGTSLCDATERALQEPDTPREYWKRLNPDWVEALMGFPQGWTVPVGLPLAEPISTPGSPPDLSHGRRILEPD